MEAKLQALFDKFDVTDLEFYLPLLGAALWIVGVCAAPSAGPADAIFPLGFVGLALCRLILVEDA